MDMEMWIPIIVAIGLVIVSGLISYILSGQRLGREIELSEKRLRRDYQLEFSTEAVIRQLLSIEKWKVRSFDEIKRRLEGLEDKDIKIALIRAGAVCFRDTDDNEMWGLVERNRDKLGVE